MKTTVLAVFVAIVVSVQPHALAAQAQPAAPQPQTSAQPGQTAAPQPQTAAPEIKDPAEYNAYVGALQQKDNNAKVSALEAFLTQYPNSVMKTTALEVLMGTYQQTGNQAKVVETAKRLLTAEPNNLRALALLSFLSRQSASTGQNAAQSLADLQQYCSKGLDALKANQKPTGMSDADFENLKKQVGIIFNGGCGFAGLQNKDYQHAQLYLRAAVEAEPNDLQNVYPLALAYLTATPPDSLNGLFFIARALNLSSGNADIQKYAVRAYKNYHGSEEGWNDGPNSVVSIAKANPLPPKDFNITKYVPPTDAERAAEIIKGKTDADIKQMPFGEWELVLSAGTPDDQNKVWNVIKGVPLQMEATVLEVASPTELHIAATEDDIEQKRVDITLTMSGPIPPRIMPKPGDTLDFEGTPTTYTATPFMMNMENGKLLKKAGATPAPKKPPVRRRPAAKPQ
jgi:hypothetical protein